MEGVTLPFALNGGVLDVSELTDAVFVVAREATTALDELLDVSIQARLYLHSVECRALPRACVYSLAG